MIIQGGFGRFVNSRLMCATHDRIVWATHSHLVWATILPQMT